jgi:PAS domain S-box-containing protein
MGTAFVPPMEMVIPNSMLHATFDPLEVATSVVIAIVASYAALTLSARVGSRSGTARVPWLIGGGLAVGLGIAGMHFVGMLAMRLSVPVAYDGPLTVASFGVAAVAATAALALATSGAFRIGPMLLAATAFGAAVSGMHYVGMAALRGPFAVSHDMGRVVVSILIAVVASAVAFWLAHRLRHASGRRGLMLQLPSATVMGLAVAGMHYTAMSAVHFTAIDAALTTPPAGIAGRDLTSLVTIVGLVVLSAAILVALFDQNARHIAREAELTNERYREMAEAMPQIVWTSRPDGSVDYFNRRWFEYTGRGDGEIDSWGDDIHPDDGARLLQQWAAAVATGGHYEIECRFKRADGDYRWQLCRATPLRGADGAIVKWFGTATDIHEQKRAEDILRQHQTTLENTIVAREAEAEHAMALYQLLAENATDMVSTHKIDGSYDYATPSWLEFLGQSPAGRFPVEFGHPEDLQLLMANHKLGFKTTEPITTVWRCRKGDGAYAWLETRTRAVHNPSTGRVVTFVCATRDISGRMEVERLKDEFVSVVSHELRTPLTSIRGSLGLLASGQLTASPQKSQRMLDVAVTNTDRLIRLINDILDVERIDSGAIAMDLTICDGLDIARNVAEALRPMADRAGVTLHVSGPQTGLWADADRLTQTLTNLVGNAIKFSPVGTTVHISVEWNGEGVLFQVRDRGRGIPADKLETIFERFQQVDGSDAREKGGTGLGLAISAGIVRQHGGRLWAENLPEGGSAFKFTMPRRVDVSEVANAEPAYVASPSMRILVIEDDVQLAQVIALALESRGLTVSLAHDGAAAVERHTLSGADVLIVDLALPDGSGLDVLDRIRSKIPLSNAPTIIYTASDPSPEARERIRALGAELATKSRVSTDDLVDRVIRLLEPSPLPLQVA